MKKVKFERHGILGLDSCSEMGADRIAERNKCLERLRMDEKVGEIQIGCCKCARSPDSSMAEEKVKILSIIEKREHIGSARIEAAKSNDISNQRCKRDPR